MMKAGFAKGTRDLLKVVKEWPARTSGVRWLLTYSAAEQVAGDVRVRIPNDPAYRVYKQSIKTAKLKGLPATSAGHAVRSKVPSRRADKVDAQTNLLYVQVNRRMQRPNPQAVILEKHSPWTIETLPFYPKPSQAKIILRKVSEAEVLKREQVLRRLERQIEADIRKAGLRSVTQANKRARMLRKLRVTPTVSFDAMKLEFGFGGVKAKSHWKPALLKFARSGLGILPRSDSRYARAMTEPGYREWSSWPPPSDGEMSQSDMQDFSVFFKKLGISF